MKKEKEDWGWGVTLELLPGKFKALGSNPSVATKNTLDGPS